MSGSFTSMTHQESVDYTNDYIAGVVVFNEDPERRQRIKVSIPNLLEGPVGDLPWIAPILNSGFGITPSASTVSVPAVGTKVWVEFQEGNLDFGVAHGYIQSAAEKLPAELAVNYPRRRGWVDPAGNTHFIDVTSGSEIMLLRHKSGTELTIFPDGRVKVSSVTKIDMEAAESISFKAPTVKIEADNIPTKGYLTNNEVNVGSTHKHPVPNVTPGSATVTSNSPQ